MPYIGPILSGPKPSQYIPILSGLEPGCPPHINHILPILTGLEAGTLTRSRVTRHASSGPTQRVCGVHGASEIHPSFQVSNSIHCPNPRPITRNARRALPPQSSNGAAGTCQTKDAPAQAPTACRRWMSITLWVHTLTVQAGSRTRARQSLGAKGASGVGASPINSNSITL